MMTENKAPACPNCGATSGIYARAALHWQGGRWHICPQLDEVDCMECDHEWTREESAAIDPFAGLAYASDPIQAEAPAMLELLQGIGRDDDGDAMLDAAGMDEIEALIARIESGAPAPTVDAPHLTGEFVTVRADHLAALIGAAESYAEDLATSLEDGTYEDRADLDAVQAAIAAVQGEG